MPTFVLATADDARVVVHRWVPSGAVRGVVNLVHGLAEHAARYAPLAEALTSEGFAVYAEDHRGHGETAASEEDLGFFAASRGWARVVDDLHRVTARARTDHPGVPTVVLGHSMGSFLVQQLLFACPDEIDAAVLSGSTGPVGLDAEAAAVVVRVERARLGPRGRSALLDRLVFGAYNRRFAPTRTAFDWLSRDTSQVDRYVADPWCGFVPTTQLFADLFAGLRVIAQRDRVRAGVHPELPVYLLAGAEDPVGGSRGIAALRAHLAQVGLGDVTHRVYPGARHEVLNEIDRDQVVADLLSWLRARVLGR